MKYYIFWLWFCNRFFLPWRNSTSGTGPPNYRGFMIILRHTTIGRTPLDEWSNLRRDLYLTTHNTHKRQDIHVSSGIRTHNPSKRAAADPSHTPANGIPLFIQYAKRLRHIILLSVACLVLPYFSKLNCRIFGGKKSSCTKNWLHLAENPISRVKIIFSFSLHVSLIIILSSEGVELN